jgi:hypothetical protein
MARSTGRSSFSAKVPGSGTREGGLGSWLATTLFIANLADIQAERWRAHWPECIQIINIGAFAANAAIET